MNYDVDCLERRTCNGEVPWHKCNGNANGLLDSEDSTVRCSWCLHSSLNTFCLASEPPCETQSVVEFALRFEQRLAGLVSDNVRQVVTILTNQGVPFEEALGTSSRVDFTEGLECLMCCFDGCVGVFCDVVGCSRPYFAIAWIYNSIWSTGCGLRFRVLILSLP